MTSRTTERRCSGKESASTQLERESASALIMHKNSQRAPVLNFNSVSRRSYKSTRREASLKIRYFDFNKFIPNFTPTRAISYIYKYQMQCEYYGVNGDESSLFLILHPGEIVFIL